MRDRKVGSRYDELRIARPELFVERQVDCYPILPGGTVLAENGYVVLLEDRVCMPNGLPASYLRIVSPAADVPNAAILPISNGRVVLLDHPRHALGRRVLEIPRGFGEVGETAEDCARRELEEELGILPTRLRSLGPIHPDSGLLSTEVALFAAEIPEAGWKTEPNVTIRSLSVIDVEAGIADGSLSDTFTIAAIFRARLAGLI